LPFLKPGEIKKRVTELIRGENAGEGWRKVKISQDKQWQTEFPQVKNVAR